MPRQFAHVCHIVNTQWGFKENRVAVTALHKCGKNHFLKFSNSWNRWKFCDISFIGQLNVIRNSRVLKTRLGHDAWKVWGSGFAEMRSGNSRSCPESWTYRPSHAVRHQGRSTPESATTLKGTSPYSCCKGYPTDKSRASPSAARWERTRKYPLHGREIFYRRGAV